MAAKNSLRIHAAPHTSARLPANYRPMIAKHAPRCRLRQPYPNSAFSTPYQSQQIYQAER